jgi:hypothetical protein
VEGFLPESSCVGRAVAAGSGISKSSSNYSVVIAVWLHHVAVSMSLSLKVETGTAARRKADSSA